MQTAMLKPRIVEVEQLGASHARVVMEPFERGYGHTLGNALRRVLLSSMIGYAPTEVQITGVVHEYSTIDGLREDVVDLLLNLKGVTFRLHNRDDVFLTLRKDTPGAVTAGDISARQKHRQTYMMPITMAAKNNPPQPPAPMPKFQPEKCPEMTAPTPNAHSDQTRACLRNWRLAKYSPPGSWYWTLPTFFFSMFPPG